MDGLHGGEKSFPKQSVNKLYEITGKNNIYLILITLISFLIQGLAILQSLSTSHDINQLLPPFLYVSFFIVMGHDCRSFFTGKQEQP